MASQNNDLTIMDAGTATFSTAKRMAGWDLMDFSRIIVTHCHGDHIADIVLFLHGIQKLREKYRGEPGQIEVIGPYGSAIVIRRALGLAGEPGFEPRLTFREGPGTYGNARLFVVEHGNLPSLAVALDGESEIIYTGDIAASDKNISAIIRASKEPAVLICDATEIDNQWHGNIKFATELMQAGGFRILFPVHTRQRHQQTVRRVCAASDGRIIKPRRGRTYTIQ